MRMQLAALFVCAPALIWSADWKPADNPLTTPWTDKVTAEHALPEYPRPQLVRPKWTNLNGLWDYAIRPKAEDRPTQFEGKLLVPFAVESALSGVKRPLTPEQRLWYRRSFTASHAKGTRLLLHFGAVDWRAEVFVNGKAVGQHEGGYDAFTFDITDALRPGAEQELVVAVWDPTDSALTAARQAGTESQRHLVYGGIRHLADRVAGARAGRPHPRDRDDAGHRRARIAADGGHGGLRGFHGDGEIARQSGGPHHGEDQRRGETAAQPDGAVVARFAGALRSGHRAEVRRLGEELLRHAQR